MGRDGVLPQVLGRLDKRAVPRNSLSLVFVCVVAFTLVTGYWPTATSVLNVVLDGTAAFLGALSCLSALSAIKLLERGPGRSRVASLLTPLFGAITLAAIVSIDVAQFDVTTRWIEVGGLLLGVPFALWRGRRMQATAPRVRSQALADV
jgi:amino acid transporter